MKKAKIEEIAYLLYQAKKNALPRPIVFLGAGASRSGNIPLANEIAEEIKKYFSASPQVKNLPKTKQTYSDLMSCLQPAERKNLLKGYIDNAKINVTHIYLAQLITQGYVDYVLTVNFDNLLLRALAFEDYYPPTYDLAILKDLTTASFHERSVLYLHGQHHGLWLLNTAEEMEKVEKIISPILNKITNERAWIVVGYSGSDPIFDQIVGLGNFDNGLYWITYKHNPPADNVKFNLLEKANTNTALVEGESSDSFFLKLNARLQKLEAKEIQKLEDRNLKLDDSEKTKLEKYVPLKDPLIFDNPFQFLKEKTIKNVVDIDCEDDEEGHFMGVKERLVIVKDQVDNAIELFDKGNTEIAVKGLKKRIKIDLLKKEISYRIAKKDFDNIAGLETRIKNMKSPLLKDAQSNFYASWGLELYYKSLVKNGAVLAGRKKQNDNSPGTSVCEQEELLLQSLDKYKKATNRAKTNLSKMNLYTIYNNWGCAIHALAKLKSGEERANLLTESIDKFSAAILLIHRVQNSGITKPHEAYHNWGLSLLDLAKIKTNKKERSNLLKKSLKKFSKAEAINHNENKSYSNWGLALIKLAKTKNSPEKEELFSEAEKKLLLAVTHEKENYNLACAYALQGKTEEAIKFLEESLKNKEITPPAVLNHEEWKGLLENPKFKKLIKDYL